MRQQEVNQFDKGLSLDKNDIAISNHELTSALNATMITMNGNELVLQNDMGNAKVESAYLPAGFVPVGIKEFGGIVYVASYNPLTKTSQLGSFPSPERNISSDETGIAQCEIEIAEENDGYIKSISTQSLLIEGPVRSGDKFVITSPDVSTLQKEIEDDLVSLKVVIVNSDGSTIDITDELKEVSETTPKFIKVLDENSKVSENDYTTYSSKISGSIYLQESLIVPDYVSVGVTSDEVDGDLIKIAIEPIAYCSDGTEWFTAHPKHKSLLKYIYEFACDLKVNKTTYSVNGEQFTLLENEILVEKTTSNETLTYTVIPEYSFGKIELLKNESTLSLNQLGTGNIEFSKFRYFNDFDNEKLSLEYNIQSYLGSGHSVEYIRLEAYKYENDEISSEPIIIELSTSDKFGSFVKVVNYDDLDKNETYIVRLKAKRNSTNFSKEYTSDWFCLFTCKFTNDIYMASQDSMLNVTKESPEISLNCELEWTSSNSNGTEQFDEFAENKTPSNLNIGDGGIINENISGNSHIYKFNQKIGKITSTISNKIKQIIGYPFKIEGSTNIKSITGTYEIQNYDSVGTYNPVDVTIPNTNVPLQKPNYSSEKQFSNSIDDSEYTNASLTVNNNSITIDYKVTSIFFAKLLKNYNDGDDQYVQNYTSHNISAFVPYITLLNTTENIEDIQSKFGLELSTDDITKFITVDENKNITNFIPKKWLNIQTWNSRQFLQDSDRRFIMGIINANDTYTDCCLVDGGIPESSYGEKNDNGSTCLVYFGDKTCPKYTELKTPINKYLEDSVKSHVVCIPFQGCKVNDRHADIWYNVSDDSDWVEGGGSDTCFYSDNYSGIILLDNYGNIYLSNQMKINKCSFFSILKDFSKLYVYQPNQSCSINYYIGDYQHEYNYYYDLQYDVNFKIQATSEQLKTNDYSFSDYENGQSKLVNGTIIHLPKFILNLSDTSSTFEYSTSSDDMLNKWRIIISDIFKIGTVAITQYYDSSSGEIKEKLFSEAYSEDLKSTEELNGSYIYFNTSTDDVNPKLTKCVENTIKSILNTKQDTTGAWLALAASQGQIIKEQQTNGKQYLFVKSGIHEDYTESTPEKKPTIKVGRRRIDLYTLLDDRIIQGKLFNLS